MGFVSIILLNYNGKKFNKPCIDSILQQIYQDFEIIFVDNASSDGSLKEVESLYKKEIQNRKIIIVESEKNTGFSGGNNLGVKHASKKSEYICLLNNDTTVPKNRLEELIKAIQSDNKLGAVGSLVLDKGYEDKIKKHIFEEKKIYILSMFGESVLKDIAKGDLEKGILYTNSLSGCCLLYKRNIIEKPFEDYYFAYAEDVFLSRIFLIKGYKLAICTKSTVNHFLSGSFGTKPSDFKLFHGNKNQIINFLIFYNGWRKFKLLPLFILTQAGHIFVNAPWKRIKSKYKAWLRIYRNRKKIKKTKKYIKSEMLISEKNFLKQLSYKFSDRMFLTRQKNRQLKVIQFINKFFELYCRLFRIPYNK